MDSLETDDQLIIVNRSMEHRISKQLIRKIPYFDSMLSHDCLESQTNKVELDFDEKGLKSFLNWLDLTNIFLEMDYVINLCNILDYFGIKDTLVQDCNNYFNEHFTIKHLPVVIPQVIPVSKLMSSSHLNAFICRYFLKIANTTIWLDYPVETIEYMCSLDLMIHSEYQVFDAIMKWIKAKADTRKCYIERLLKLVRWCHFDDKDLSKIRENELTGSSNSTPEICSHDESNCNCITDRTKQGCFVSIEELDDKDLRVKVLDGNFGLLINQVVRLDEFMPLILLQDEHVSDISFDSGRQMIRIDWKQKKYRLLDFTAYKSYYQIYRSIFEDQEGLKFHSVITKSDQSKSDFMYEISLLEAAEKFILVRNGLCRFKCWENPSIIDIKNQFESYCQTQCTYLATVLDNDVYALTRNLGFFRFNINECEFNRIELPSFKDKKFVNLLLTSKQANDDRVIFIDKTTKDVFCFNVSTQEWKSIDQIIDCKSNSSEDSKEPNVLKTFTFGFISLDSINLCFEHKLTQ